MEWSFQKITTTLVKAIPDYLRSRKIQLIFLMGTSDSFVLTDCAILAMYESLH